jgi:probable H4MPT-linked C1 transfer pathway protein
MIGIDVGGANVKIADDSGIHVIYAPLWTGQKIAELLEPFRREGKQAAVVMSGELADCFQTKMDGIGWIMQEVRKVFPEAVFFGTDGRFHTRPDPSLAAANWLASAVLLEKTHGGQVFLDMGSTTTDIIPLHNVRDLHGYTDIQRLREGFLVYTGMLRTNIATQINRVVIGGMPTPLAREYFACSADAHLVLGHISPEEYTVPPPDGCEKTLDGAMRRLARCACADIDEIGRAGCTAIAREFWESQRSEVTRRLKDAEKRGCPDGIITAGIGGRLFASYPGNTSLDREFGSYADGFPAFAVRELAG